MRVCKAIISLTSIGVYLLASSHDAAATPSATWQQEPGLAISIDATATDGPWIVGTDNNIYSFTGTNWKQHTTSNNAKQIAVSPTDSVWVLDSSGRVGQLVGSSINFLSSGAGDEIIVLANNLPCVRGGGDSFYCWDGSTWHNLGGVFSQLAPWTDLLPNAGPRIPV